MCGRFTLRTSPVALAEIFALLREPVWPPRYNITPSQPVAVIRQESGARVWSALLWGLIPSWSKDAGMGARMINARAETVAQKPSFRGAFRHRRCLIPADGFYEWKKAGGKTKQPFYIGLHDERPFAFAGLWEHWEAPDGSAIESCTIITTEANDLLHDVHDRMPVILSDEDYDRWIEPQTSNGDELQQLLRPYPSELMACRPISTLVNNPKNDAPECIEPAGEQRSLFSE
jgi:putative SOS response-associated peptidase YedK